MALSFSYNTEQAVLGEIFRATSGGTVFSANLASSTDFDLFPDNAVVDDAIYFNAGLYYGVLSDLTFNIKTAIAASSITIVWEYFKRVTWDGMWVPIENLLDETNSFTTLGVHRVKFPLQWKVLQATVNGLGNRLWYRCRISSVNNITEGGANQTNTIKRSDGVLTVSGGTDLSPASFTDIYNWIVANLPYISVGLRNGSSFDFTKVALCLYGRLKTTSEIIELGQNCLSNINVAQNMLDAVESGVKSGERGYKGSVFIVHGGSNSSVVTFGVNSKMYGTTFKSGKDAADNNMAAGYCQPLGEIYDCSLELALSPPSSYASTIKNLRIVGSLMIASNDGMERFVDTYYITYAYVFLYLYQGSWTMTGFGYQFTRATGYLFNIYQSSGRFAPEWILINPSVPIPNLGEAISPVFTSEGDEYLGYIKRYSAGNYTSYGVAPAINIPLGGEVGDIIYFGVTSTGVWQGFGLNITKTTEVNDYVYAWEYWDNGAWNPVGAYFWDDTNNMGKSGVMGFGVAEKSDTQESTTVDGVSAKWVRARIVSKGTITPVANIYRWYCSMLCNWKIIQKYSFDLKVTNSDGVAISDAVVVLSQGGVQLFSLGTDINGRITQQNITTKQFSFDISIVAQARIKQTDYTGFVLSVTKNGYIMYMSEFDITEKMDWEIALSVPTYVTEDIQGEADEELLEGDVEVDKGFEGVIEEVEIYGEILEEEITG